MKKLDLLFAICKANCNKCGEEGFLFIPVSVYWGLLCEKCMVTGDYEIDHEATKRNLGGLYPKPQ